MQARGKKYPLMQAPGRAMWPGAFDHKLHQLTTPSMKSTDFDFSDSHHSKLHATRSRSRSMDPAAITPPAFSLTCTPSAFERIELSVSSVSHGPHHRTRAGGLHRRERYRACTLTHTRTSKAAVGKVSPESESDETYLATTEEQSPAATKNYFREAAPARRGSLLEPSPAATKNPFREDALSHGAFSRSPEPSPAATNV